MIIVINKDMMESKQNRVAPFLNVYIPQVTSLISIMQRVTGVLLFCYMYVLAILKICMNVFMLNSKGYMLIYYSIKNNSYILNALIVVMIFSVIYHIFNGLRYVYWQKTGSFAGGPPNIELESIYNTKDMVLNLGLVVCIIEHYLLRT